MGNLLMLNFGIFTETNRFKEYAIDSNFLSRDPMDDSPPGELVSPGGVRGVWKRRVSGTYSFYGFKPEVWRSRMYDGRSYKETFKSWIEKVLRKPVHCVYLTGHNWGDYGNHRSLLMSWGESTDDFHMELDIENRQLYFGVPRDDQIEVDTKTLRYECKLVLGFGCNLGTGINSYRYQSFFRNKPPWPIILSWDRDVPVPRHKDISVNERFFEYVHNYVQTHSEVAANDRLKWFHSNRPMELVRAWGYAALGYRGHKSLSLLWNHARARNKDGTYYKFEYKDGMAEPVKA